MGGLFRYSRELARILYIDDDADGCEMIVAWLHDHDVTTVGDGRQAKELMQRMRFDLYILDFYLPDMTAVELCEDIRRVSPRVPIIIYSALTRWADKKAV
ncbi:MAG: response regulator, partial [Acidobacteriota bacterium]